MTEKKDAKNTDAQHTVLNLSIQKKANAIEHRLRNIQSDTVLPINKDSVQVIISAFEEWKADYQQCDSNIKKYSGTPTWKALDLRLSEIGKRLDRCIPEVKNFGVFDSLKTPGAQ